MSNQKKGPCEACGSSDANVTYLDDGHQHCFSCGNHISGKNTTADLPAERDELLPPVDLKYKNARDLITKTAKFVDLKARGISMQTCQLLGYQVGHRFDNPALELVHVANYFDDKGNVIAQKTRDSNKDFTILGNTNLKTLYGMWAFPKGGNTLIITEGEIDCLSVIQMTKAVGMKAAVVSVPKGAKSARSDILANLEYVNSFKQVVISLDNDDVGRKATQEVAALLDPGKAYIIAPGDLKDANEYLTYKDPLTGNVQPRIADYISLLRNSSMVVPDGVVNATELLDGLFDEQFKMGIPYPWDGLNDATMGIQDNDLVVILAGQGSGKTTTTLNIVRSIINNSSNKIGLFYLEDTKINPLQRLASQQFGCRVDRGDLGGMSKAELIEETKAWMDDRVYVYHHDSEPDVDTFLSKIKFMAKAYGVKSFVLDNLSPIVAELGGDDKTRMLEKLMRSLYTLCRNENVNIFVVSHLAKPSGDKDYTNGIEITMNKAKDSTMITANAHVVMAIERDVQDTQNKTTRVRLLKRRGYGNKLGVACILTYDDSTDVMTEVTMSDLTNKQTSLTLENF